MATLFIAPECGPGASSEDPCLALDGPVLGPTVPPRRAECYCADGEPVKGVLFRVTTLGWRHPDALTRDG